MNKLQIRIFATDSRYHSFHMRKKPLFWWGNEIDKLISNLHIKKLRI